MAVYNIFGISVVVIYRIFLPISAASLTNSVPLPKNETFKLPGRSTAIFYESPDQQGARVAYKDTAEGWTDLQTLFTSDNLATPALLCVKGVWLIYGNKDFETHTSNDVHLVSGNENCIKPPDVAAIGAMQPASPSKFSRSSVTVFTKKFFGSSGATFSSEGGIQQLTESIPEIGSVLVVGKQPWSLMSSNGRVFCVRPKPNPNVEEPLSMCYSLDMEKVRIADFQTVAVTPGCPPEHHESVVANLKLMDCKKFGVERIETMRSSAAMGRSLADALECRQNVTLNKTKFTEEQSALIMKLIKIRLTHDFLSKEQILWPDSKDDIWKTVPLDTVFDIFIATAPSNIINLLYVHVIREFTVFHLNEIWKKQNESSLPFDIMTKWREHKTIVHFLDKCLKAAVANSDRYASLVGTEYDNQNTLEEFHTRIHPAFKLDPEYDPVIETAYLVANYAMGLCHELLEYKFNFWDTFVSTFSSLYFEPLFERWTKPKDITPKTFRVILSGFGTDIQYKKIAFATTTILQLTPNLQPFEREFKYGDYV